MKYDLFICHASEDKEGFATPLAEELRRCGLCVWYDDFILQIGDSLSGKINEGLKESKHGILIISPHFFRKKWPQREYGALSQLMGTSNERKLLPIWHGVDYEDVKKKAPLLSDIYASRSAKGISYVINDILSVVRPYPGRCKKNSRGDYLCRLCGGPFEGIEVLLIDADVAPKGGPKDILKDDVLLGVNIDGKTLMAGLVRRKKYPHMLSSTDKFSLPLQNCLPKISRFGPRIDISIVYARYIFSEFQKESDGDILPVFTYLGDKEIVSHL